MTITLSEQQLDQLAKGRVLRMTEPKSKKEYVVLEAQAFEKMQKELETEVVDPSLYEFEELEEK